MKACGYALLGLLSSGHPCFIADLYKITLVSGAELLLTSWDEDLINGSDTYLSNLPIKRNETRCVAGLESDALEVDIFIGDSVYTVDGVQLQSAVVNGALDGAKLRLDVAFMGAPDNNITGSVCLFEGFIATASVFSTSVKFDVRSELEKLNIQYPKNVYSTKCQNCLYDSGCQAPRNVVTGTVTATSEAFLSTDLTNPDSYFDLGAIKFTSGACKGLSRSILSYINANGAMALAIALPVAPGIGDGFEVVPGCAHDLITCTSKFSNQEHFRGFPFVPIPETVT